MSSKTSSNNILHYISNYCEIDDILMILEPGLEGGCGAMSFFADGCDEKDLYSTQRLVLTEGITGEVSQNYTLSGLDYLTR